MHRDENDELLGFLAPAGDTPGLVTPMTVFGYPLGAAQPDTDALRVLASTGLSYLAERWTLTLAAHSDPISVQIVEASPERLTLQSVDDGHPLGYGTRFELPTPVDHRLALG